MGLFDFFKGRNKVPGRKVDDIVVKNIDRSNWTGKDFEFLIAGDLEIGNEEFDDIMTPSSMLWIKTERDNWNFYQVGNDEFSYSIEPPGIQMTFNNGIIFNKAKTIADEVIEKLKKKGYDPELIILNSSKVYKF
jgi:hypothetical protein